MSPVQQAFAECHGLQCGFCTPGFLTTITAYLAREPRPDRGGGPRGDLRQPVPLHRLPEHRQDACCAPPRSAPSGRREPPRAGDGRGAAHDDEDVRRSRSSARRTRASSPATAATSTTSATTRWRRRSCAARTPTPGSSTSTSPTRSTSRACVGDLHLRGPRRAGSAEPLPLLIPHPTLTHGRTGYALAKDEVNHVGEAVVMVVATDRYVAEDAVRADPGRLRAAARRRRHRGRPRRRRTSCTTTCPATSPPTWCRRSATSTAAIAAAPHTLDARPRHRAQRLHADGGQGRLRPLGRRRPVELRVLHLDPDLDRRAGRRRRQARPAARPRSSASPPTSAAASASRSCTRGPRRCWCRWAARAARPRR